MFAMQESRPIKNLLGVVAWLIGAPAHVPENKRRFVMLTNGMFLLQTIVGVFFVAGIALTELNVPVLWTIVIMLIGIITTGALWWLSRRYALHWVIWGNIIILSVMIWLVYLNLDVGNNRAVFFLLMPMFFASVLLPNTQATLIGMCNVAVLLLVHVITRTPFSIILVAEFAFLVLLVGLLAIGSWLVERQNAGVLASEKRLRALMEANREIVVIFDRQGRILDVNSAFERTMGFTRQAMLGRNAMKLVYPDDRDNFPPVSELIGASIRARGLPADGTPHPFEISIYPYEYERQSAYVLIARDMSEQERIEKEREESQRQRFQMSLQQERMELLQAFIGDASHHFRTPLANIKTSAYLLTRTRGDDAMFDKQVSITRAEIERMERLLDNLLLMTRLNKVDSVTTSQGWRLVRIDQLVDNVVTNQKQTLNNCTYHVVIDANTDVRVMGRHSQLQDALKHLLHNARTYCDGSPEVTVHVYREGDFIHLTVVDNGIGIDEADMGLVFDNFYRGRIAHEYDPYATGLGLSIVRRIIQLHRGYVEIKPNEPGGTMVHIILPHLESPSESLDALREMNDRQQAQRNAHNAPALD